MKNERGITLIALAATLIVMSILAVVSINVAFVENSSVIRQVENETEIQQHMMEQEQDKTSNIIKNYEEEWGLS